MEKVYYLDNHNRAVDKEHATHFYIHYYNDEGELIDHKHFLIRKV